MTRPTPATIVGLALVLLPVEVPAQTKTPVTVLLSYVDAEYAGLAYAVATGVYARAGLDVTFTEGQQPDDEEYYPNEFINCK